VACGKVVCGWKLTASPGQSTREGWNWRDQSTPVCHINSPASHCLNRFFDGFDWDGLRDARAPFRPELASNMDTVSDVSYQQLMYPGRPFLTRMILTQATAKLLKSQNLFLDRPHKHRLCLLSSISSGNCASLATTMRVESWWTTRVSQKSTQGKAELSYGEERATVGNLWVPLNGMLVLPDLLLGKFSLKHNKNSGSPRRGSLDGQIRWRVSVLNCCSFDNADGQVATIHPIRVREEGCAHKAQKSVRRFWWKAIVRG